MQRFALRGQFALSPTSTYQNTTTDYKKQQIGHQHGTLAASQIQGSISFYSHLFQQTAKLSWAQVQKTALEFKEVIQQNWPNYLEEMQGIADGANKTLADIIALNVRTEINFGLFSDGCTALAWLHNDSSILAQNWDVSDNTPIHLPRARD